MRAGAAEDHSTPTPSFVAQFLYGHALELAFKAILIVHGTSERVLRNIGHDLARARDAAIRAARVDAVPVDAGDSVRIDLLSAYYQAKALEYVEPGVMRLPILRELRDTTEKVVDAILPYVEATVRTDLKAGRAV